MLLAALASNIGHPTGKQDQGPFGIFSALSDFAHEVISSVSLLGPLLEV